MKIDLDKLEASLAKQEQYERGLNYNFAHAERLEILNQIPALIAELRELREDAARARWCEEKKASVFWSILALEWRVAVYDEAYNSLYTSKANRNAAIDAARGKS